MKWLGVDIGGTNTKIVVLDDDSWSISDRVSIPTDRSDAAAAVKRAAEVAAEWVEHYPEIEGVGVTIPGHFDAETGRATVVPNIPGNWFDLPVRDRISDYAKRPADLINDARAFGLAESRLGAARDAENVVALVLGTGVGGAVILGGQLYHGRGGAAGEIGHMVLKADGPPCGCGNHGCLEALTRSDLLAEAAGAASVAEAVSMANAGGERARSAIDEAARWIGLGLANVTTLLAPDVIVIGGGIAQAGELLFRPLREELALRSPLVLADTYQVLAASLGTDAGAMGAAIMIRNRRIAGEGS